MDVRNLLAGNICVRIISANIEDTMAILNKQGVLLTNLNKINDIEVEFTLSRHNFSVAKSVIETAGGTVKVLKRTGIVFHMLSLGKRPIFLAGLLVYMLFVIYLPTRILFVQVEGNQSVSSITIIEQAQRAGIRLGVSRSNVRSERVKNILLAAVPELQWVGVNTYGCVAVISVKERSAERVSQDSLGVCSIVAQRDGIVDEIILNRGNLLCKVGQAVTEGQVLVSGYTDCGISIKATAADAEVYARTFHDLQLIMPTWRTYRTLNGTYKTKYSLIFGKKQIKLYKDSGISDVECVKMNTHSYLTLPGGYVLPIGIIKETLIFYNTEDRIAQEEDAYLLASSLGSNYIKDNMVAGEILSSSIISQTDETVYKYRCKFFCREMIGKAYKEETVKRNE